MININIFDEQFFYTLEKYGYLTAVATGLKPTKLKYIIRDLNYKGATVFTDRLIYSNVVDESKSKYKIAWLLESPAIEPECHSKIGLVLDKFDLVLTSNKLLSYKHEKIKYMPFAGCYFFKKDYKLHQKTKLVSHIVTNKLLTKGHILRHQVANFIAHHPDLNKKVDIYKPPFKQGDPFIPYCFSIVIENCSAEGYFTEKVINAFITGTMPLYFGDWNLGSIFNPAGFFIINNGEDFEPYLKYACNKDLYNSRLNAIKENMEIAKKYASTDDILADTIKQYTNKKYLI